VVRSRAALVRARTDLINHVRGLVKSTGDRLPSCSSRCLSKTADQLPQTLRENRPPPAKSLPGHGAGRKCQA
jgi:hypothetical protein